MTQTTMPDILVRLKVYEEFGPLSCVAIHPETPGYTTGMVLRDTRDARTEIERLRAALWEAELYARRHGAMKTASGISKIANNVGVHYGK